MNKYINRRVDCKKERQAGKQKDRRTEEINIQAYRTDGRTKKQTVEYTSNWTERQTDTQSFTLTR
jgi:hypothetical protein